MGRFGISAQPVRVVVATALAVALTAALGVTAASASAARDCGEVPLVPGADLRFCDFSGSAALDGRDLTGADLRHADLVAAHIGGNPDQTTILTGADLRHALASGADFSDLRIVGADLRHADFDGASFETADLVGVDARHSRLDGLFFGLVVDSDLRSADLADAQLHRTVMNRVDAQGADFAGATVEEMRFIDTDLRGATGLESAVGIETVSWTATTCPDGTDSDANGGTCLGHLTR
jgi:uncharacterized protein YjbI with pentapeptide repeats